MRYPKCSIFIIILTLSLSLFTTSLANAASSSSKYEWAKPSVEFMASHKVMQNFKQEEKNLSKNVSKAELTRMIYLLFQEFRVDSSKDVEIPGVPATSTYYQTFRDVYGSIPSNPSGLIAAADKINYNNGTFTYQPSKILSRWDLLITLNTLFPDIGYSVNEMSEKESLTKLQTFKDIPKRYFNSYDTYEKWNYAYQPLAPEFGFIKSKNENHLGSDLDYVKRDALLGFSQQGVMKPNSKGYFYPNQKVTLAETAVILHRIYKYYGGTGYVPKPSKDEEVTNGTRLFLYKDDVSTMSISDDFALVNADDVPTLYLALSAKAPVDLKVIVNGEAMFYTYERLSILDAPVIIPFDGAYFAEIYPTLRSTGELVHDVESIQLTYYVSDKLVDFNSIEPLSWQ
ncbi:S-layer homology domain-containing protein [Paenibacillus sp. AD87]|uniref:S-layer homology domain-containing protein n=1 Tax=Paenibacillus sp. AD87 TaxID=1528787 RepID=UPI0007E471D2|nr:S-layer homology domain-containing protein [Paenibacillus sp. AD87]OAX45086.1 hypothetical protein gpAD87_29495 [Paenibacillus sp. AD87]